MKLAIISDIHGNYDALSTLAETYDELWALGDLVNYGPQPHEVLQFIREKTKIVIRGNHDNAVGRNEDPRCTPRYALMAKETCQFSTSVLSKEEKGFLAHLPLTLAVERAGARFYLCHAAPSDPLYAYRPKDSDEWERELDGIDADFVLTGHTHVPFVRQIGSRTLANPGSLGQPKVGSADVNYAVWEDGNLQLKSLSYPISRTVQKIERLPLSAEVKQDLITVLRTGSLK
jgi:putative phosphoesterase